MGHAPSRRMAALAVALVAVAGLAATSCERLLSTKVAKIQSDLVKYDGTVVSVHGKVKERIDLPTLKCYVVDDGSGSIGVITHKPLPHVGDVVSTRGKVQSSFKIGKRSLIVVIEPQPPAPPTPKPLPSADLPS